MKKIYLTASILVALIICFSCSNDIDNTNMPENECPTLIITSPIPYTGFNSGEIIQVKTTVEDVDGNIKEVRFYLNGEGEDAATSFPYNGEIGTSNLSTGNHLIRIEVEDDDGSITKEELPFWIKPKSPTNLQIVQNDVHTFSLNWSDNSEDEEGFTIERKIDNGNYIHIATITQNTFTDSTVSKKGLNSVFYRIKAFKDTFHSDYTENYLEILFPSPSNLTFHQTTITSTTLKWDDNSIGEYKFEIERKLFTDSMFIKIAEVTGDDLPTKTWNDTVNPNLIYNYRIRAIKDSNTTEYITSTYINNFPAPTELITDADDDSINLAWIDNSAGEEGFIIERKINNDSWIESYASVDSNENSWNDLNIISGNTYSYRVRAFYSTFFSSYTDSSECTYISSFILTYGGDNDDSGSSVKQTTDGGFIIVGYTSSFDVSGTDIWLIKTDIDGNEQWSKTFGGISYDSGSSIQQTTDGGYIILGNTRSYGAGNNDIWLIKTDSLGNEQWNRTFGSTGYDVGYSVQQTSDGGYIISGHKEGSNDYSIWLIKTDSSGNEEWNNTFDDLVSNSYNKGYSVQQTSDGGYIVVGNRIENKNDIWLIKTDSSGNEIWDRRFPISVDDDYGYSVQQTTDRGFIIAGESAYDLQLIKTTENGSEVWEKTYAGSGMDYGYSVQQTIDGGYIITGKNSSDMWLIKTDGNGEIEWDKTYGGIDQDLGSSVIQTSDGRYVITGYTYSFGATGEKDIWLIKTDKNGNVDK